MLGKILLLGLALWLVLPLLRQYRRSVGQPEQPSQPSQDMVRCSVCGVHLPKSESFQKNGQHYCCTDHSQQSEQ
jgi:uncharacterized protein